MIPAFDSGAWYLPEGIHIASLDEIEDRFVTAAPFADSRDVVFRAFLLWHGMVSELLPEARYWVNGGFLTHKPWGPPSDVDVTVLAKPDHINGLSESDMERLEKLFTVIGPPRVQPMSGLVDAFLCLRGDVDRTLFWRENWSKLLDPNKQEMSDLQKGFVEVRP